jgi:hypothetical protein
MPNKTLIKFIKEARKRGFSDVQIHKEIEKKNWPLVEAEKAFLSLQPKITYKNQITLFLNQEIMKVLQTRAKKNLFTISEQIEDILRRSCSNKKRIPREEKIDDKLLLAFSRPQRKKK